MQTRRSGVFDLTTIVAVILLCAIPKLFFPFHGDQASFSLIAQRLSEGAVLYRDVWDMKQPGVFGFYLFAGQFDGFSPIGVHLLELAWMLLTAVLIRQLVLLETSDRWQGWLAATFAIGMYYLIAGVWHLTQVEGLIGLPLVLCVYCSHPKATSRRFAYLSGAACGICLAIVGLFKLDFCTFLRRL